MAFRWLAFFIIIANAFLALMLGARLVYGQTLAPCRTQAECYQERFVLRERAYDPASPSLMFELRRLPQQDESRRQTQDIMRQWDNERSRGGYPCASHEARCR